MSAIQKVNTLGLPKYDAMLRAIAACHRVDEAKEIRNQAKAFETYAKQAKNREAETQAAEVRIRAERKAGEFLKAMKQNGHINPGKRSRISSENARIKPKLLDYGITYDQSSQWQELAEISEADFEEAITRTPEHPASTEGIILEARAKKGPLPQMDNQALNAWGRLKDFERGVDALLEQSPVQLYGLMTEPMQEDVKRIVPKLIKWLARFPKEKK